MRSYYPWSVSLPSISIVRLTMMDIVLVREFEEMKRWKSRATLLARSNLQRIFKEMPSIEQVVMKNLAKIISHRLRDTRSQLVRLVAEMIKQVRYSQQDIWVKGGGLCISGLWKLHLS